MAGPLGPDGARGLLREVAFPVDAGALQPEGDQLLLKARHSEEEEQETVTEMERCRMETGTQSTSISLVHVPLLWFCSTPEHNQSCRIMGVVAFITDDVTLVFIVQET